MIIIPAIDLKGGRVVRLTRGDFAQEIIYSEKPLEVLGEFEKAGATLIHIVDLDGALSGKPENFKAIKALVQNAKAKIELGGGLRTHEAVKEALDLGVYRVILGTKALNPDFLKKLVSDFGEKIVVGIDIKNKSIRTEGWCKDSGIQLEDFLKTLEQTGVKHLIATDIQRDGAMKGANVDLTREILEQTSIRVIHSGGITAMNDLEALSKIKETHFEGVIVGKAIYEKKIDLAEAVRKFQGKNECLR